MIVQGRDLMLFVGEGDNIQSIAFARNCTLSIECGEIETTGKNDGIFKMFRPGPISWSLSTDGLTGEGHGISTISMLSYIINRTIFNIVFAIKAEDSDNVPTNGWSPDANGMIYISGSAFITSASMDSPTDGASTYSITMRGEHTLNLQS